MWPSFPLVAPVAEAVFSSFRQIQVDWNRYPPAVRAGQDIAGSVKHTSQQNNFRHERFLDGSMEGALQANAPMCSVLL